MSTPPARIVVEDLHKTYRIATRAGSAPRRWPFARRAWRSIEALAGVGFVIEPGTITGLIGPNGAGKSTAIKILSGILRPSAGHVTVGGLVPWADRILHVGRIGVVFGQRSQLWWDLPVAAGFALLRDIYRVPPTGSAPAATGWSTGWACTTSWTSRYASCRRASGCAPNWRRRCCMRRPC
ncbi:ATP-binding cassette domain-containing protein [Gluconacetobacter azotocaptans]|uniref:ATP-binding cassette domain-containing protein n=1 Tax=Gluconacetobacter azotocaptans TaxID=142834 RepID=UPI001C80BEAB|nr:ATP-binding cassette domain-containing protein [Gluconacetobacter azotocaptans]GBQ28718.1 hypothetical protein AA13594_1092 [Gluconacetobacter azotocaptans DSM 13594]